MTIVVKLVALCLMLSMHILCQSRWSSNPLLVGAHKIILCEDLQKQSTSLCKFLEYTMPYSIRLHQSHTLFLYNVMSCSNRTIIIIIRSRLCTDETYWKQNNNKLLLYFRFGTVWSCSQWILADWRASFVRVLVGLEWSLKTSSPHETRQTVHGHTQQHDIVTYTISHHITSHYREYSVLQILL